MNSAFQAPCWHSEFAFWLQVHSEFYFPSALPALIIHVLATESQRILLSRRLAGTQTGAHTRYSQNGANLPKRYPQLRFEVKQAAAVLIWAPRGRSRGASRLGKNRRSGSSHSGQLEMLENTFPRGMVPRAPKQLKSWKTRKNIKKTRKLFSQGSNRWLQ